MKRIMLVFVCVLAILFLSDGQSFQGNAASQPATWLFDFFGTLCLLALLDVNARKVFALGRHFISTLFHGPHTPHHSTS